MSPLSLVVTTLQRFVSGTAEPLQADDGQSVLSKTDTLFEGGDGKDAKVHLTGQKPVKLDASSTSFAKAAKKEGWGARTATRPSLGGM